MAEVKGTIKSMIQKGQDPKDYLIEVCRPQCTAYQQKLQRCETALKNMANADPELSCMYPLRDWVTCVDSCVRSPLFRCSPRFTLNWSVMSSDLSHDLSIRIIQSLKPSPLCSNLSGIVLNCLFLDIFLRKLMLNLVFKVHMKKMVPYWDLILNKIR